MSSESLFPAVPTVDFYGDAAEWSTSTLLHSEPLMERSRLHAWRIKPHRHSRVAQLFWLSHGTGGARFDGERYELAAPCVVVVPEQCVHEFEWEHDCDGFALSVESALVRDLRRQIGVAGAVLARPGVLEAGADQGYVDVLFSRIQDEYVGARPLKEMLLESLVKALAIWVARCSAPARRSESPSRAAFHYERFTNLLERHHRAAWNVARYAEELTITAAHLNAICRQMSGKSALRLIHERVLLAARRELAYTDKSIADIASSLGFAEPSYFTRFFKGKMRQTPKEFRRFSGTSTAPGEQRRGAGEAHESEAASTRA